MNQPTEEDVASLLAAPKILVSHSMQWRKKPSSHTPAWWEFMSALEIAGETPADLFVRLNWSAPIPGAVRPRLSCSLLWHGHRVLGVDMDETRHLNPPDIDRPYAGKRLTGSEVHHHIWHGTYGSRYAAPLELVPNERAVFAYFARCATMTMRHEFSWPSAEIQPGLF
ncbi:hypothetical protein [Crenobacter cavernae]|uniref:Uncharacterized protein n=1 Tax=Crenobacter cavernae TaxID=2290923 RepID=A0ABY0FDR4_9NEIS|nr:hypothetical protein [Crenobacter cavernae]RXZ42682.1 hypothetical protein EBB06_12365 [Crenobacter cavernae]